MRLRGRRETAHEESPGFLETGCRRNSGKGDFKESATEINRHKARMERRGKSPPLSR